MEARRKKGQTEQEPHQKALMAHVLYEANDKVYKWCNDNVWMNSNLLPD